MFRWVSFAFRIFSRYRSCGIMGEKIFSAHTPDAAEITQTGRAYLQVGNNEVYELFQSAWSGADYQPDKDDMVIEDYTIHIMNKLG